MLTSFHSSGSRLIKWASELTNAGSGNKVWVKETSKRTLFEQVQITDKSNT